MRDEDMNDRWGRSIYNDYHGIDPRDFSGNPIYYEKPKKNHPSHCMCNTCDGVYWRNEGRKILGW